MTSTYVMDFTDPNIKPSFVIPEYKLEGPQHPLSSTLASGIYGSSTAHTSLLLVGKGIPNYGEIIQENMVYMLENFASNGISPAYQTVGQLWFNNSNSTLHVCTNSGGVGVWEGLLKTTGGTVTGNLIMDNAKITGLPLPIQPTDAVSLAYVQNQTSLYLPLIGGTLTGTLILNADPTAQLGAATKQYVEDFATTSVATHANNGILHLTQNQHDLVEAITVTSSEINHLSGVIINIQTQLNNRINKAGDTMLGYLSLSLAPTDPNHATTKTYVDTLVTAQSGGMLSQIVADGLYVNTVGDSMTGYLTLFGDPVNALHAATKQYVDNAVASVGGGGTADGVVIGGVLDQITGTLTLSRSVGVDVDIPGFSPILHQHTSTDVMHTIIVSGGGTPTLLDYTFNTDVRFPNIPMNEIVTTLDFNKADYENPTFVGTLAFETGGVMLLDHDPIQPLEAATKQYVDTGLGLKSDATHNHDIVYAAIAHNHDATYVNTAGDTMTGLLVLSADPTIPLHATTKQYVDTVTSITRLLVTSIGQTVFTTPPFTVGSNNLWVFVNGVKAYEGSTESYTEDNSTQITFTYTIPLGAKVEFMVFGV